MSFFRNKSQMIRQLHNQPSKPKIQLKQTTVANAHGSRVASPTIMNGVRGTPAFPSGTLLHTVKQRSPYFIFGLLAISCLIGWPVLFKEGLEVLHQVPPKLQTALVQETEDGYGVGEIKEVHRDLPADDE